MRPSAQIATASESETAVRGITAIEPCANLDWVKPDHAGDVDRRESLAAEDVNLPFAAPEKPGNVGGGPEGFLWFGADGFSFAHTATCRCQLCRFPGEPFGARHAGT